MELFTEEERCRSLQRLLNENWEGEDQESPGSLREIISLLDETELTADQKWSLIQAAFEPLGHFKKIQNLLEEGIALIMAEEQRWRPAVEDMAQYWENQLKQQDIASLLQEYLNAKVGEDSPGVVIIPGIMGFNEMSYMIARPKEVAEGKLDLCRLGLLFDRKEHMKQLVSPQGNEAFQKKYVSQVLKCLADKSKLEILALLRQRRMYGSELAAA